MLSWLGAHSPLSSPLLSTEEWNRFQELVTLALTPLHVEVIVAVSVVSALLYWIQLPDMYDEAPYEPGTTTYEDHE